VAVDARAERGRRGGLLRRLVLVRDDEAGAVLWAFVYFFTLLASFYLLRPVREEMGIRSGPEKLQWLFSGTFAVMLAAVPLYSALVARVPRSRAIPLVYRFFLANVLGFWALLSANVAPVAVARVFFVWLSVYNLFVVAVFWSYMADLFTSEQGKRLFGFVAGGGSAGAIAGSAIAGTLVHWVGVANLFLVAAVLLEVSVLCARRLARWAEARAAAGDAGPGLARAEDDAPLGGSALDGFREVFRSRYLGGIALQLLLYSLLSTFLYFQQARIVADALPDPARRTSLFAAIDLTVNVAALGLQSLAFGRIAVGHGLGPALSVVPAVSMAAFAALAAAPSVWTLGIVQAVRRTVHYGFERPGRDALYTVVERDEKYKAKSFIDTVVYRGGDALWGWAYAGLAALGLGLRALAVAAVPVAALALGVGLWLARRHARLERA
jgi:AAA family ATP:ADP antiporter